MNNSTNPKEQNQTSSSPIMVKKLEIKHSQQIPEFPFREIVNGAKPKMYAAHYKPPAVGTGRADEHLHGKKERKKEKKKKKMLQSSSSF